MLDRKAERQMQGDDERVVNWLRSLQKLENG